MLRVSCLFTLMAAMVPVFTVEAAPEDYTEMLFTDLHGEVFATSSELEAPGFGELGTYGGHTLFDAKRYTGWSEGARGYGIGESIWLRIPHGTDTLAVINGFARTQSLFYRNSRVQTANVSLHHGFFPEGMVTEVGPLYFVEPLDERLVLRFQDHFDLQEFSLPFRWEEVPVIESYWRQVYTGLAGSRGLPPRMADHAFFLRLEIQEVYRGSSWDDTCLTELRAFNKNRFRPTQIFEAGGTVYYDTANTPGRILAQSDSRVYQLIDSDATNRWALIYSVPRESGGRVAGEYLLFQAPYPTPAEVPEVETALSSGALPTGFVPGRRTPTLRLDNGTTVELPTRR